MNTTLEATALIREDDLAQHAHDDATSRTPIVLITRPRRYNAWDRCQETRCCGRWWRGDICLYGNHALNAK